MSVLFWGVLALLFLIIAGYGLGMIALAALKPAAIPRPEAPLRVTVLIAAHNEASCIADKLRNVLDQDAGPHEVSIMVACDGCSDGTAEIVRTFGDPRVRLVELTEHGGKVAAMNRALASIGGDVVVFSDANSMLMPNALRALLRPFADPAVGGVCGAPAVVTRSGWLGKAEHLYWCYDNALKQAEARLGGAVSATGSLYAMRRVLLTGAVPPSVADDFHISTQAVVAGLRLDFAPMAACLEEVSPQTKREFGRRVRSTERGWRGLLVMRRLLNPLRTGGYAVQLLFHKVLRRMVPLLLLLLLAASVALAGEHWVYAVALAGQSALYGVALAAALWPAARRLPGASLAFFFTETQVAMALGLARVALGLHSSRWTPVRDIVNDPRRV
jgi:cellulose synthase/poly-beta-1,6-N-acetylglucosamine synthase-like glycosyltransferase